MKRRRVKITGIGFVTPAGIGRESFQRGILEHRSHVGVVTSFPEEAGAFVASEVRNFSISDYYQDPSYRRLPRHTQFALAATKLALRDAGLSSDQVQVYQPAIITGTSLMDSDVINRTIQNVARKGPRFALARVVFQGPVASIAATVAATVGGSRTLSLQSACCSGSDAVGHGAALVANGEADMVICGGTEAPIYYHPMLELRMAELSPATAERPEQLARPFDLWRTTGVIGEGACMLVLEPEESTRTGYAYISGYSYATDRSDAPGLGLVDAIRFALANACVRPEDVDGINAWGPGHREIDIMEASALRQVLGNRVDHIPCVSIKGSIGNPFAAAGAIQAGCAALSLQHGFVPPTVNWQYPDPSCRLNLSARPRYVSMNSILVNSHGLSGTNSSLYLERCN